MYSNTSNVVGETTTAQLKQLLRSNDDDDDDDKIRRRRNTIALSFLYTIDRRTTDTRIRPTNRAGIACGSEAREFPVSHIHKTGST